MAANLDYKQALLNLWTKDDPNIKPLHVLLHLKTIRKTIVGDKGQEINLSLAKTSYDDWDKLTESQAKKVHRLWEHMTPDERNVAFAKAREMNTIVNTQRAIREAQAMDHEYIRLLYLVKLPEAIVALTAIRQGLDRAQLDAIHLGNDDTIAATDPYRVLTGFYNNKTPDTELNQRCVNPCVKRNERGDIEMADPLEDGSKFNAIFPDCKHIDPKHPDIPERDHEWIKIHMKKMEKVLSDIAKKFTKSGMQRGFDVYTEWARFFADKAPAWAKLAVAIMDYNEMASWSYDLPDANFIFANTPALSEKTKCSLNNLSTNA
eukprot:gene23552-28562_t